MKNAYTHVDDAFVPSAPCRFCDDPSYTNNKGAVEQTGTAEDGRPLYAHPECDDPFAFSNHFTTLESGDSLECPNCGAEVDRPGLCKECNYSDAQHFNLQANPVDVDFVKATRVFNSSTPTSNPLVVPPTVYKNPKVQQPDVNAETQVDATNMSDGKTISPKQ